MNSDLSVSSYLCLMEIEVHRLSGSGAEGAAVPTRLTDSTFMCSLPLLRRENFVEAGISMVDALPTFTRITLKTPTLLFVLIFLKLSWSSRSGSGCTVYLLMILLHIAPNPQSES